MAQWVKGLAACPEDLSSVTGSMCNYFSPWAPLTFKPSKHLGRSHPLLLRCLCGKDVILLLLRAQTSLLTLPLKADYFEVTDIDFYLYLKGKSWGLVYTHRVIAHLVFLLAFFSDHSSVQGRGQPALHVSGLGWPVRAPASQVLWCARLTSSF